jgi:hypothetical protein
MIMVMECIALLLPCLCGHLVAAYVHHLERLQWQFFKTGDTARPKWHRGREVKKHKGRENAVWTFFSSQNICENAWMRKSRLECVPFFGRIEKIMRASAWSGGGRMMDPRIRATNQTAYLREFGRQIPRADGDDGERGKAQHGRGGIDTLVIDTQTRTEQSESETQNLGKCATSAFNVLV